MKKCFNLLVILVALVAVSVSCSKDDDDDKTYEKTLLIGTWEQSAGDDFVACPSGDNAKFIFSETKVTEYSANESGCIGSPSEPYEYTFDDKKISFLGGLYIWTIEELTATSLKVKASTPLVAGVTESLTFVKQ